ncbi:MAG: hypothetical protein ACK5JH_08095 [Anaerocolumna sp.]
MDTNDTNPNLTGDSLGHNGLSHALDIMKAAFPHLDSSTQQSVDLLLKTGELMDSITASRNPNKISSLSLSTAKIDIEALLTSIRNVCYEKERELIDMVLNFFRAKNLFDTYTMLTQTMSTGSSDSTSNNNFNIPNDFMGGLNSPNNPNMQELLESMLTPEQKSTFDNLSMMFSMMNTSS